MKNDSPLTVDGSSRIVICNAAILPESYEFTSSIRLEYNESDINNPNIKLGLPDFIRSVSHIPNRILDLLEIAAYVYCADRLISRGNRDNLEYHSWSRLFHFVIKVRDYDFWNSPDVIDRLEKALTFMSGDRGYNFTFQPEHLTPPAGLFDKKEFQIEPQHNTKVILFSGGLDSLVGIIDCLKNSEDQLYLVSHRSGQPRTAKTQDQLIKVLKERFPNRIKHFKFRCNLRQTMGRREETQRTRFFLYSSIAYALSSVLSDNCIYVYENGITSINFPKRQDQMNARASRTTHPKTIVLLENFFNSLSEIDQPKFKIATPFLWKTKTDILCILDKLGQKDLISSSVSCSHTSQNISYTTHCGGCSQCIDRRFAAYGSELDDVDESGIYASDFILGKDVNNEVITSLIDYVNQARYFTQWDLREFSYKMANELSDLIDFVPGSNDLEKGNKILKLCSKHGRQVEAASRRMREIHDDDLYRSLPQNSYLQMIADRRFLEDSIQEQHSHQAICSNSQPNSIELFYSYSHTDEELRDQLENHLSILKWQRVITNWHDRKIGAGTEWEGQIDEHLNSAQIILLLISSDFISSPYCYDVEMGRAMERHEANEARVIPILLRPVYWKIAPFAKLNALPTDGKAVTSWDNQDEAFLDIVEGISKVVDELKKTLSNNDD